MTITEKVAFLKGLTEGLNLDDTKSEGRIIKSMLDILDDIAVTLTDVEENMDLMAEQLDTVDEDLDALEEYVYSGLEDDEDLDDTMYEVECPNCGKTVYLDEEIMEEGQIECPSCGETLEFDICDENCGCAE